MRIIGLCLSLLLFGASYVSADAVTMWNENAARAARRPACIISGNGLAESRMYAMVHAAVHDAVNAIHRRSRPYAFDAEASATCFAGRRRCRGRPRRARLGHPHPAGIARLCANGVAQANACMRPRSRRYQTAGQGVAWRWGRLPRRPSSRCGRATDPIEHVRFRL